MYDLTLYTNRDGKSSSISEVTFSSVLIRSNFNDFDSVLMLDAIYVELVIDVCVEWSNWCDFDGY